MRFEFSGVLALAMLFAIGCTSLQTNGEPTAQALSTATVAKLIESSKEFQKNRPELGALTISRKTDDLIRNPASDPNYCKSKSDGPFGQDLRAMEKLGWGHFEDVVVGTRGLSHCEMVLTDAGKLIAKDSGWTLWPEQPGAFGGSPGVAWKVEMASAEIMKVLEVEPQGFSARALFSWRYRPTEFATKYREQFEYQAYTYIRDIKTWDDLMLERRAIAKLQKSETGWEVISIEWEFRK